MDQQINNSFQRPKIFWVIVVALLIDILIMALIIDIFIFGGKFIVCKLIPILNIKENFNIISCQTSTNVNCEDLEKEIKSLVEKVKVCQSDSDCVLDEALNLGCPLGCYLLRNKSPNNNEYLSSIVEKVEKYQKSCPICLYECPYMPEQKDIICQNNKCIDKRFKSLITDDEEKIEIVFNTYLLAEEKCNIDLANSVITEKSKEIMHYTCSNMVAERECYAGKTPTIFAKEETAIIYYPPFNHKEGWPLFFARENGEWKIDFYKMAFGIAMGGSGCDTGWSWRNSEIIDEFCSYFLEGECPESKVE